MNSPLQLIIDPLWLQLGLWLERKGLDQLAETCYRNCSSGKGKNAAEAGFRLSQQLIVKSRFSEAVEVCERALRANPQHAKLWCALGAAQRRLAQMDSAAQSYQRAIQLLSGYAQAWNNLGEWFLVMGDLATALEKFEQALKLEPRLQEALNNRVATLYELARFDEAEAAAREAIDLYPRNAPLHVNLGNVLLHTGKSRLAVQSFRQALDCDPACPEAHLGLATLLGETHRLAETLALIEHVIAVKGESAQRLASLAQAQQAKGDWLAAEATGEKVLQMQPNNISALITLAGCLSIQADHHGAIGLFRRSLVENAQMPGVVSCMAFNATYLPDISAEELFAYHREWAVCFEVVGRNKTAPAGVSGELTDRVSETVATRPYSGLHQVYNYNQTRQPDRPLRIGYVSGDFGTHPVGFLLRDVMRRHDRRQFPVYCYSMMRGSDDITAAIRENADEWVDAFFMDDDELVKQIQADQIDILVDLSGHTAYNRLPVFVRKPAPVQATWIGYFHSTGLKSIDYFITDPFTSPKGCGQLFSEIPVWLPHSRFCYSPLDYAPEVSPPPMPTRNAVELSRHSGMDRRNPDCRDANNLCHPWSLGSGGPCRNDGESLNSTALMLTRGQLTFGSFNRIEKLVDPVIAAWTDILHSVPGSRLLVKSGPLANQGVCDDLRRRFNACGLASEQLELRGPSPHPEMLEQYGEVDIALDPFPFNGGMTTLEALWMGVPVVTVAGVGVVSRQTLSALENIGMQELIYPDVQAYIQGTIGLAGDPEKLAELRQALRPRMAASPICQAGQFTRDLENLYRKMWQAWCRGERLKSDLV